MALSFDKIEAVKFGGVAYMPQMTQELRLRLKALKITPANLDEAKEQLSKCFGDKAAEVKAFMDANMFERGLAQLQVYLTQGPEAAEAFQNSISGAIDTEISKIVSAAADAAKESANV